LNDEDALSRHAAITALGQIGSVAKVAVAPLLECWNDGDRLDRRKIAEALKKIDPEAAKRAGIP
jgi:HEAT repeat protein